MKDYFALTKPGIVEGNALSVGIGFLFASTGAIAWTQLFWALVGISLIVASACVFNNYYDRELDAKMARTNERPLAAGRLAPRNALVFGAVLFVAAVAVLWFFSTLLALAAALAGFVVYVFWYTPLKPRSSAALYVGGIAGAMPPLAGYFASPLVGATPNDYWLGALAVFAMLYFWQLPHFLAIAIYRGDEYKAAGVPVVPLTIGTARAKFYLLLFTFLFALASLAPVYLGMVGSLYLWTVGALSLGWLAFAARSIFARGMGPVRAVFFYSLAMLPALCVVLLLARALA